MATKKKASPAVEAVTSDEAKPAVIDNVVQIAGYRRPVHYARREFRPPDLPEGAEPLWAKVRSNLTFERLDAIPFGQGVTFNDTFAVIAPYVVEWNVQGENLQTGEWEPVPPPAEAGPSVFEQLDHLEAFWIIMAIKQGHNQKPVEERPELTEDFLDESGTTVGPGEPTNTKSKPSNATAS